MYSFLASGVLVAVWALLSQSSCGEQGLVHRLLISVTSLAAPGAGAVGHAGFSTCGVWLRSCSSQVL